MTFRFAQSFVLPFAAILALLAGVATASSAQSSSSSSQSGAPGQSSSSQGPPGQGSSSGQLYAQEKAPSLIDPAGPTVSLIPSESVFAMAAALNACGYDEGRENSAPVR